MDYEPRVTAVHRSLHEIKTYGGVEDRLAILNGTLAAAMIMGAGQIAVLPFSIGVHFLLRYMTKRDPFMRRVYLRYNRQYDYYDPWPHCKQHYNHRPDGCGKGMLC